MSILKTTHRIVRSLVLLVSVVFLISACSFWGGAASQPAENAPAREDAPKEAVAGYVAEEPAAERAEEGGVVHEVEVEKELAVPLATAAPAEPLAPAGMADNADEMKAGEVETFAGEGRGEAVQQSQPLRAGEVDDNAQWDDYLLYRRNYGGPYVHDRDVSERYIIEVKDGQGNPVLDAAVRIFLDGQQQNEEIYRARTYANGQALFHPQALHIPATQADHFLVEVAKDNLLEQFTLTRFDAQASNAFTERWTVTLDAQKHFNAINLDVLFLIDATGSMADEIAQIQSTIFDVAAQIDALPGQPEARYGMVTYRDRGDSFISRVYDFTPDVRDFSKNLSTVYAEGGGDYPESLNEGLHKAVNQVEWRTGNAVKLIFLVADAPPHLDYAQDYDYAEEMESAARRGIKIFPIASSGLDDQGEYVFRQLAQYTMGRFIFLTYEGPTNSGAPGDTTTHHVEDYSVENLDKLLVRLVQEELAWQNSRLAQGQ
ncbi:MAG: VWA domain-containing protein [Anaerolineae bacterium]|nr:VWA domain-containing protein [Anaerolineae bacterium]